MASLLSTSLSDSNELVTVWLLPWLSPIGDEFSLSPWMLCHRFGMHLTAKVPISCWIRFILTRWSSFNQSFCCSLKTIVLFPSFCWLIPNFQKVSDRISNRFMFEQKNLFANMYKHDTWKDRHVHWAGGRLFISLDVRFFWLTSAFTL